MEPKFHADWSKNRQIAIWAYACIAYATIYCFYRYEKVSDVEESREWFANKNLTPRRMHFNGLLIAKIERPKKKVARVRSIFDATDLPHS